MDLPTKRYNIPIWLSKWVFKDARNKNLILENHVVKGKDKESILSNERIVNNAVYKLIGRSSKKKLVVVDLTLISQHGYGVNEN